MKTIAIVNTRCFNRISRARGARIIDMLKKRLGADISFTRWGADASKIAEISSGYELLVAVGGDGTIFEIINGMSTERQLLSMVPLGTGNGLANDLGLGRPETAIDKIKNGEKKEIDLIRCEIEASGKSMIRYAASTCGMGFAADTVIFADRYLKKIGSFCYPAAACVKSFGCRPITAKIKIDAMPERVGMFTNFFINNTAHSGISILFPKASLNDAALNIFFLKSRSVRQWLWNISTVTKTHFYRRGENIVKNIRLTLSNPEPAMLDGEILNGATGITYSVVPKKLKVIAPIRASLRSPEGRK